MNAVRHFVDLWKIDAADLRAILDDAHRRKAVRAGWSQGRVDADAPAAGRTLAMIFECNSTRTRFSIDAAIRQLGGASLISTGSDMQLGRGETIEDTARVLSRMVDAIMVRAQRHATVEVLADVATVPVINGLTPRGHPCQILADLMTLEAHDGQMAGKTIAWVGDANNVCSSYLHVAGKLGFALNIACPSQYGPAPDDLARATDSGARVTVTDDPRAAVAGADCVVADTWVSMGDTDRQERLRALGPYRVDEALMETAGPKAVFLHCLPAHRGEEVTDAVLDGPRSLAWEAAENRIHAQKSILAWCFGAI